MVTREEWVKTRNSLAAKLELEESETERKLLEMAIRIVDEIIAKKETPA
jgi:flagellar biosynthesis/type III secretory pathway protein FliH